MTLKMALVGPQIRHLKTALQCLGKIGSELLLEALPERLILRSINSSRSAYVSITFYSGFFDGFDVFDSSIVQAGVLMKQIITVFRTQKVSKMLFELDAAAPKMAVRLFCDNGLQKVYKVPLMDSEILQATTDKEAFPTCVVAEAAELNKLLASFQSTLDEITIIAKPETATTGNQVSKAVQLHSYFDPAKGHLQKSLYTQLSIDTHEVFRSYQHTGEEVSDVTFNLKDFKTMLALCEAIGANVALYFDKPGSPLVVEPHTRGTQELPYEAVLVLATLLESQAANIAQHPAPASTRRGMTRTPGGNIPGDTPWLAQGGGLARPGVFSPIIGRGAQMQGAAAGRPSRFAQESGARGNHQQAQEEPDGPAAGPGPESNQPMSMPGSRYLRAHAAARSLDFPDGREQAAAIPTGLQDHTPMFGVGPAGEQNGWTAGGRESRHNRLLPAAAPPSGLIDDGFEAPARLESQQDMAPGAQMAQQEQHSADGSIRVLHTGLQNLQTRIYRDYDDDMEDAEEGVPGTPPGGAA